MNGRLTRRLFLKLALTSMAAAACTPGGKQGQPGAGEPGALSQVKVPLPAIIATPTPTITPAPTPTPLPSADGAAYAFLSAWAAGDYDTMYGLLTNEAKARWNSDQFRDRYQENQDEATVTAIRSEMRSLLTEDVQASASFHVLWQTNTFGSLEFDNVMPLRWQDERWVVDWSSPLILPQLGDDQSLVFLGQDTVRGNIYERNGLGMAVEGRMVTIGVVPGWIVDRSGVVIQLSAITGLPPDEINAKIDNARPEWFVPIADVPPDVSVSYNDLLESLEGVQQRERSVRAYNAGELGSHLVGHLGAIPADEMPEYTALGYDGDELVGRAGTEAWGETYLAGKRGGRLVTLNRQNQESALVAEVPSRPGDSLYLTIDKGIQADAENILGQRLGAIVVLDVNTGSVLAMASYPRYDPNLFVTGIDQAAWAALNSDPERPLVGRGSQGLYPPGSVFKIVTIIAALEQLGSTPDSTFSCSGTWRGLGDEFVKTCWLQSGHGVVSLKDGLTQSCDVVFYELGLALHNLDPQILPTTARACGLGQPTGITGVEEAAGLVPDRDWKLTELGESWFPGDSVNMAIGQSYLLTTPLQIANLLAAVGNDGTLYRPQLIQRIAERTGVEQVSQPEVRGYLPVSAENLAVIRSALEGVVSGPRGTAREAFYGANFTAAGKTGTSETGQEDPHAWFAGYTPADAPQIAISVILEHAGEGSQEAAPLFRQMAEAYYRRTAVPQPQSAPSPPDSSQAAA